MAFKTYFWIPSISKRCNTAPTGTCIRCYQRRRGRRGWGRRISIWKDGWKFSNDCFEYWLKKIEHKSTVSYERFYYTKGYYIVWKLWFLNYYNIFFRMRSVYVYCASLSRIGLVQVEYCTYLCLVYIIFTVYHHHLLIMITYMYIYLSIYAIIWSICKVS